MPDFLVFKLYGPLAAWGDIAVGEVRPSTPQPSKSAVLGLIAAALGIRRHEDEKHRALASAYGFAARVDAPGVMVRDFHTTQRPENTKRLNHLRSRRDETGDRENLYTILSTRDYRCDALYTVCLWGKSEALPYALGEIGAHLARPLLPLYLGRKSCPLALPIQAQVVAADTCAAAFAAFDSGQPADFLTATGLHRLSGGRDVYWEPTEHAGLVPRHSVPRQDLPLSRQRWQFGKREEHYGILKGDG